MRNAIEETCITSTSNPQIRRLIQLRKKASLRTEQDVFVVEGIKMYQEAPTDHLVHTYVSRSFYGKHSELAKAKGGRVTLLEDRVFETVSDTKTPQGILCLVRQYHYGWEELVGDGKAPLILALESLQDPGNLGTIVRTAEGAGVSGLLLSADCVDLYNPKVIRSTMGSVYRMPFYYAEDFAGTIRLLQSRGVAWYAAHLHGTGSYAQQDYRSPSGFLIGNESRGLTDRTAELADVLIRIPMCGRVESLNAAVAASILMYEANRQRSAAQEVPSPALGIR